MKKTFSIYDAVCEKSQIVKREWTGRFSREDKDLIPELEKLDVGETYYFKGNEVLVSGVAITREK